MQGHPLCVPSSLQAGSCRQEEGDHKGRPYFSQCHYPPSLSAEISGDGGDSRTRDVDEVSREVTSGE